MFKKFLWISAFSLISKASLASYLSLGGEITDEASKKSVTEWVERMQLPAAPKDQIPSEVWDSWNNLESYTQQTLENFKNGDPRGIIMVHAFEDQWRADRKFIESWNHAYPDRPLSFEEATFCNNDQRKNSLPISSQDFIDHYVEFVLKHRYNIAASLISFNKDKSKSSSITFGTCGVILAPSVENILVTARQDASSGAQYFKDVKESEEQKTQIKNNIERREKIFHTLDNLIRYPFIRPTYTVDPSGQLINLTSTVFNEIVVSACAADNKGKVSTLKIAGFFINKASAIPPLCGVGYYKRTKTWQDAVRTYAAKNSLPLIEFNSDEYVLPSYTKHAGEVMPNFVEFFDSNVPEEDANNKYKEKLTEGEKSNFRFTPEMLAEYGLKLVEKKAS